jgi:hypothetical protein
MLNQSIAGIHASQFLQVPAIVEASAYFDSVSLVKSIAGDHTVTVVTNLIPNPSFPSSSPEFTFKSIVLTVSNGLPIKVIYYWATSTCSGPATCTAALSQSCTSVSVSVSSTAFNMPDVALMYLDAGNNVFNVSSNEVAPNPQQVFLNTSLQPKSLCLVPSLYSKFSQIPGNSFLSDGKTMNPTTLNGEAFPYFENKNDRLLQLSKYLSENRLIAGSRFLITMNGNTFRSGSGSIANVDNNQLSLDINHGSTFLLAFFDDDWDSRVSTLNVSLGSLKVSAFDSSCNVNIGESSPLTLNLHFGVVQNSLNCNSSDNAVSFYGLKGTYRFVSGKFNISSLYISRPKSGPYFFCICTTSSCTSKPFEIISGAPVDLVLVNLSMASSFDRVGQGLGCNPILSPDCSSNTYIEFMASSFDINDNRVTFSNYSFSVAVQAESGVSQSMYLWEHQTPLNKLTNRSNPLACSLSSPRCKMFLRGVRGAVYSLNISLVNDDFSPASRQLVNERRYTLGQSPFALGNASREHYKETPLFFASAALNVAQSSINLVQQSLPSFSINSFMIAPCPSGQVSVVDDSASGEKFGRCQCDRGYQQDRLKGDATSREKGYGDTISCSFCPKDTYQPDVGGEPETCKPCQPSGLPKFPSSTLNAEGQISASACKCAPDYLYVRPVLLPGTSNNVSEVCLGLYNSTATADCFCLLCDKKKQLCPGGGDFVPLSTNSQNSTAAGTAISNDVFQGLSYFSFFNNSAYYGFLANTSALNQTASVLIQSYKMSSAAMACGVRADGQSSCQTKQNYDGNQCQEGYTGFLCSSCATYDTVRWARSAGKSCIQCQSDNNLSNFLLFILFMGILLVCSYFIGEARKPQSVKNKFSVGTKTFLNHLQVISFMSDLQSQWSSLVRSMFSVSNLSNLGINIGNVGCSVPFSFQSILLVYCLSPFLISLVPSSIYAIECLVCYRKLVLDTRRRRRLARNNQVPAALLNIDKGSDLDYIQSRYSLEETELLHLTLTWKEHLRTFKKDLTQRDDISPEEYIDMRLALGTKLLTKQFWTDSVVVLLVVTFLTFSTISRQIFYTFSLKESASRLNAKYAQRFHMLAQKRLIASQVSAIFIITKRKGPHLQSHGARTRRLHRN